MSLYFFFLKPEISSFQLRIAPDLFVKNVLNYFLLQIKIQHRWFMKMCEPYIEISVYLIFLNTRVTSKIREPEIRQVLLRIFV